MTENLLDKRREFRFQLKGHFDCFNFAIGAHCVFVETIDVSRIGIGLIVNAKIDPDEIVDFKIHFSDSRSPVTLNFRFLIPECDANTLKAQTRCGLVLSDHDKNRGIDLIALLKGTRLRLLSSG